MKKNIHKQIVAAASPTIKKTAATAPLLCKNWEPELESLLGLNVGFATISVKVTRPPLLMVDVNVDVISGGAVEVVCPRLLVVWMKTVLESVVAGLSVGVLEVLSVRT
jgi:hypothetical protein